ncbi:MAG TPA: hypothetical protein PKA95_04445 [Thermomicrobiales bacterium]|nr:hypothetical protein [Thermomicrobiales bacterium]
MDLVVLDEDPLEDGLVELASDVRLSRQIELVAVGHEVECRVEAPFDGPQLGGRAGQVRLECLGLAGDACLLALEQIQRHRIGVVRPQQLLALGVEVRQSRGQPLGLVDLLDLRPLGEGEHLPTQRLSDRRR